MFKDRNRQRTVVTADASSSCCQEIDFNGRVWQRLDDNVYVRTEQLAEPLDEVETDDRFYPPTEVDGRDEVRDDSRSRQVQTVVPTRAEGRRSEREWSMRAQRGSDVD